MCNLGKIAFNLCKQMTTVFGFRCQLSNLDNGGAMRRRSVGFAMLAITNVTGLDMLVSRLCS